MIAEPQINLSPPPGPKGHFLLGVMRDFNDDTLGFIERCRDFGDVVKTRFLWVHAYFLYNPRDIESLLTTNAKSFRKAQSLRSPFFARLVGNGLVTSEGEFWRRQRRLAQPAFHRQRISSYGAVMVEYAQRALTKWREGETLDISREMNRLTLEIVVKTLRDPLIRVAGVSGATELGDGRLVLILDVAGLLRGVRGRPALVRAAR